MKKSNLNVLVLQLKVKNKIPGPIVSNLILI